MRVPLLLTIAILAAAGCTSVTRPPAGDAARHFRIVLDQAEYTVAEASQFGIQATVTNTSERSDFYAKVGDAMGADLEQPTILAAIGTHAMFERRVGGLGWRNATAGILFEGSRFVALRAGRSYRLGGIIGPPVPGTYRIRLDYSATNDDPSATMPYRDYSATFRVR